MADENRKPKGKVVARARRIVLIETIFSPDKQEILEQKMCPGWEWLCPKCNEGLRIYHARAVQILGKGGAIPVNECGNPGCKGPDEEYNVVRQLMLHKLPEGAAEMMAAKAIEKRMPNNVNGS